MTIAVPRNPVVADVTAVVEPRSGLPGVVGAGLRVPVVTGERVEYANLDHAASAPCLEQVRDAVDEVLPWYASVHRGAGFASQVSTRVYEQARTSVRRFLNARDTDAVVFARNTTDALNLLARSLPKGTAVVLFDTEHHAALLPWRGPHVRRM
ncbi:MAG: aminotransferase class V-fold PLP-dependent enzyme, partial [Saccharothrix sp.]|nr:aminotransferase class V-fold PLP-dependent enzyme [Saccharothrix sp.]